MLLKLQNGTDVRGVACKGVPGEAVNLTPNEVNRISQAFIIWLSKKTGLPKEKLRVAVGHDSRITADTIKDGVLKGIAAQGAAPTDSHLSSTPSMFMSTVYDELLFDGSIMITASHLPFNRNGMKFFDREGGLEKADITDILNIALELRTDFTDCTPGEADIISIYSAHLVDTIKKQVNAEDYDHPLKGLKVLVDAGNGAGGFFVDKILAPLGADTTGSQFLEPDGNFPNHIPNPENKEAMASIQRAVVANKADLGIIFDTDVDRMSAVLPDGTPVNRDAIIAMMAAILAEEHPGSTIVTDSVTSDRLREFLEGKLKLKQLRFKRGYKNVINQCKKLNAEGVDSPLAIETSGHGALKENYYLDDGAFMAVKLLIFAAKERAKGRDIAHCIKDLKPAFAEEEIRIKIQGDDFASYGRDVLSGFEAGAKERGLFIEPDSYEGIRIKFAGDIRGWMLLRMSLHDPLLPLNIEGEREGDTEAIKATVLTLLKDYDRLDLSVLK